MSNSNDYVVFLKGHLVDLVILEKERDTRTLMHLINDQETKQFLALVLPMTMEDEEKFIDRANADMEHGVTFGIVLPDGKFIGLISLAHINYIDCTAETGSMIGYEEYRGCGYGTDARLALLDYAFNLLGLRKICSSVIAFNGRSTRSLEKCGYTEEARRKDQFFRFGKYHDEILMAVDREGFLDALEKHKRKNDTSL